MCRWPLRAPTPLLSILWPIIDPILVTFREICNFRNPSLVTFYFYELTHFLDCMKNKQSVTFANRKYEELSYPKNQKMCDPILVTLLKIRPHYSQSSRENATPSSGTSPLAAIRKYPSPPGRNLFCQKWYINWKGTEMDLRAELPRIKRFWVPLQPG